MGQRQSVEMNRIAPSSANSATITISPQSRARPAEMVNGLFKLNFAVVILASPMVANISRLTASGEGLLDSSPVLSWLRLGLALFGTADLLYITVVGNLSQFFAHLQLADEEGWNAAVAKRLLQRGVARRSTASFSEMMTTGKHTVEVSGNEYLRKVISGVKNELRKIINDCLSGEGGFSGLAHSLHSSSSSSGDGNSDNSNAHWVIEYSDDTVLGTTTDATGYAMSNETFSPHSNATEQLDQKKQQLVELCYITPAHLVFESTWMKPLRFALQLFPWSILSILVSELIVALHDRPG